MKKLTIAAIFAAVAMATPAFADNHEAKVQAYLDSDVSKWQKTYQVGAKAVLIDGVEEDGGVNVSQASLTVARDNGFRLGAVTIGINVDALK